MNDLLITYAPLLINIGLLISSMIWTHYDFFKNSKDFWNAVKGKDKVLQIEEVIIYIYIRVLPILIFADLYMDLKVSSEVWYSLDFIFATLIGANIGHKHILSKKEKKSQNT